ncbi:hypothetical protein Goshw_018750 [Gossypium schwendimanii]|uniref:Uncharacterized protein n=1 Tax=Gossypium schwendimanii TaxID=34291 RepID=A0A7J9ND64_GOSSC|nr:hypothetical protein [Gossypium schwendimanii]
MKLYLHQCNSKQFARLLHIWEGPFGAYNRRICGFISMFKVSSRQSTREL